MAEGKSVFISYCSKDKKYVKKMTQMLEKMGISYWIAPDMIPAGSNYAREIPSAIRGCEVFLLVLSEASQRSIWVEKEIDSAIYYRRTIVPFQIDDAEMSDLFRFYLNNVQTIYCVNRPKQAIEELKGRLRLLVTKRTPPPNGAGSDLEIVEELSVLAGRAKKQTGEKPVGEGRKDGTGKEPAGEGRKSGTGKEPAGEGRKGGTGKEPAGKAEDAGAGGMPIHQEEEKIGASKKKRQTHRRVSGLDSKGIPIECEYCGGSLCKIGQGVFLCEHCGKENYDYFKTVRNYLQKHGAKPALVIERDTGVPRRVIEDLLIKEYLEIPKLETARLSCHRCGAPIRTGTLCEACKYPAREAPSIKKGANWRSTRR